MQKRIKSSLLLLSACCLLAAAFYSCTGQSPETAAKQNQEQPGNKPAKDLSRFPNEDSELALLMRDMYTDMEQIKQAIEKKQMPADFREKFAAIHTATPTDSTVRTEGFKAMSEAFLKSLDAVYQEKDQVTNFNLMVRNCVSCHQMVCPGPIKRIQKLNIPRI